MTTATAGYLLTLESPISTYGGRGCTKPGLAKWQHCMVFTDKSEPSMLAGEEPGEGEHPMLASIRVRPTDKRDKMFPASRIHYGKVYTVEHNVKVYDFGDVHKDFLSLLSTQWDWVFNSNGAAISRNQPEIPSTTQDELADTSGQLDTVKEVTATESNVDPQALPVHGTAINPWDASTNEDQLDIQANDRVFVMEYRDANWFKGRNERTGCVGIFPIYGYVRLDTPDYATALRTNKYDKNKAERLVFKTGDRILVKSYINAGWDLGYNTRTGDEGRYAYQWVKMDRGRYAIAKYDYPWDGTKPDHLAFNADDRILVTAGYGTNWPQGRNERTRQEGKFPVNYVKYSE
jgi:hypothetical protein